MTAEQYLAKCRCYDSVSNKFDMCYMDAAYKAIEMAREEERRNAVNQLQIVLTAIML